MKSTHLFASTAFVQNLPFPTNRHPASCHQTDSSFYLIALVDLEKSLAEKGQQLLVEFKSPADAIPELITQYNISHIYRSNSASEYKRKIWDTLNKRYSMIQFNQIDSHTLFDKSQLPFTLDKLPDSFSKFRRMVSDIAVRAPLGKPPQLPISSLTTKQDWQTVWKAHLESRATPQTTQRRSII